MSNKRNYIDEILNKKARLLKRSDRFDQFKRRVEPVVAGFRATKELFLNTAFRRELLKYCPIGYIASVEGYFRLLYADLIDSGTPYVENVIQFKDIKFTLDAVLAVHTRKVTLGEFIAHLLPLNNISDINYVMSTIIGQDFIDLLKKHPTSNLNPTPIGKLWPNMIGDVEEFFLLRHLYAHELATKEKVNIRKIEKCMGSTALFIISTENLVNQQLFKHTKTKRA